VHVTRIGLTPLKGARHGDLPYVDLTLDGPVGDRTFCLVDRARRRVVRTVENPTLVTTTARWHAGVLTATVDGARLENVPVATGETVEVDYWGRPARLELVDGPWAAAYSAFLGYDVALARTARPGEVVYGAPVSLVTSSSLDLAGERAGDVVDGARFRTTFTVDTGDRPPHVEDSWHGRRLRLGEAEVEVRGGIPRCAVIDLDPVTGQRMRDVLGVLAGYRRRLGEVLFGVDAVVTRPGRVDAGSLVEGD
jgi:uncharacterized protein